MYINMSCATAGPDESAATINALREQQTSWLNFDITQPIR